MRSKGVLLLALLLACAVPARAQITIAYPTFVAGTVIDPDQMNSNFSTLTSQALNRTGGTITGNITVSSGITVDGADISSYLASGNVTATGNLSAGGTLAVTGTSALTGVATFTAAPVFSAGIADVALTRPTLTNYRETKATASISSGTLALNLANGNHFAVALNANITTFTVSNVPASGNAAMVSILFTADGTLRSVTWPVTTKWSDGTAPTMSTTNGKVDIVTLYTVDGGTTWYGILGGQAF